MRKMLYVCISILLILLYPMFALAEGISGIQEYFSIYGYDMPQSVQTQISALTATTIKCGEVSITLGEVLYDGRWIYTIAYVAPIDPRIVLLLPADAWLDDSVNGNYQENERNDNRSFLTAAKEDGKRLICVNVYPQEFDALPEFFMDHLQRPDNVSVLISGGEVKNRDHTALALTWKIKTYEVNTATGQSVIDTLTEASHIEQVKIMSPMIKRNYWITSSEDMPFETVTLIKSGLTVYAEPQWKQEEDYYTYDFMLLDASGKAYPKGAPPEISTYTIDTLPDALYVCIYNSVKNEWGKPVMMAVK